MLEPVSNPAGGARHRRWRAPSFRARTLRHFDAERRACATIECHVPRGRMLTSGHPDFVAPGLALALAGHLVPPLAAARRAQAPTSSRAAHRQDGAGAGGGAGHAVAPEISRRVELASCPLWGGLGRCVHAYFCRHALGRASITTPSRVSTTPPLKKGRVTSAASNGTCSRSGALAGEDPGLTISRPISKSNALSGGCAPDCAAGGAPAAGAAAPAAR